MKRINGFILIFFICLGMSAGMPLGASYGASSAKNH